MQLVIQNLKKYKKTILLTILVIFSIPLIGTLIDIIFTYGNYIGTFIRNISENGVCF